MSRRRARNVAGAIVGLGSSTLAVGWFGYAMWGAWFGWDRQATGETRDGRPVFRPGPFDWWQIVGSLSVITVVSVGVYLLLRLTPWGKSVTHRILALVLLTCAAPVGFFRPYLHAYTSFDETGQSAAGVVLWSFTGLVVLGCILVCVELAPVPSKRIRLEDL